MSVTIPEQAPRPVDARGVVMVDDHLPQAAIGAGHPRGAAILRALAGDAREVIVCATQAPLSNLPPAEALPPNVRFAGAGIDAVVAAIEAGASHPGVLWIGRPNNMQLINRLLRLSPALFVGWRLVYDAEAVFALRDIGATALRGEVVSGHQRRRLLRAELLPAESARAIVAVSRPEAVLIEEIVRRPVFVASYPAHAVPTRAAWSARRDLLFVGAATGSDSPNGDSLTWFLATMMPELPAGLRLRIAGRGTGSDGWLRSLAGPKVDLLGALGDLVPLFDSSLAFVAPTRYGAGVPIKVLDAARHGLPVIASSFIAGQLGWRDGEELLVADDAETTKRAALALMNDETLWIRLREKALAALARDHDPERFRATVRAAAFGTAG
jgi:Glycosyl transferases group 1